MISALLEAGFEWSTATSLAITRFLLVLAYVLPLGSPVGHFAAASGRNLVVFVATYHLTYSLIICSGLLVADPVILGGVLPSIWTPRLLLQAFLGVVRPASWAKHKLRHL